MKITNKNIVIALIAVFFVGLWNLVNYLLCSLILDTDYAFSPLIDLLIPAVIGLLFGVTLFFLRDRLRKGRTER